MKTYTKKQLVDAMEKYHQEYNDNPSDFDDDISNARESAEASVKYLLKLVK